MKLIVCGATSSIAEHADDLLSRTFDIEAARLPSVPEYADAYLICAGKLYGREIGDLGQTQLERTFALNFSMIAQLCDRLIARNDRARICIIGSHSGFEGSFDMAYAGAKAAMHLYIEKKPLRTAQQLLIGIAPHIIADAGMTEARADYENLIERGKATRIGRWLQAREVAKVAAWALRDAPPACSNQLIRMRAS